MKRELKREMKKLKKHAEKVTKSEIAGEFKEFILKGNRFDMAIGVIIGAAFSKIISSLVSDIIMPIFGILLGGRDFRTLAFTHSFGENIVRIPYGMFLQNIVDFMIIAFSVFLFVKLTSFSRMQQEVNKENPNKTDKLLTEIRDLLKEKKK